VKLRTIAARLWPAENELALTTDLFFCKATCWDVQICDSTRSAAYYRSLNECAALGTEFSLHLSRSSSTSGLRSVVALYVQPEAISSTSRPLICTTLSRVRWTCACERFYSSFSLARVYKPEILVASAILAAWIFGTRNRCERPNQIWAVYCASVKSLLVPSLVYLPPDTHREAI
jgi:hypothetical protein